MYALVPALIGALISIAGSLVGRILIALGITYVTYSGASAGMAAVKAMAISKFNGLPTDVLQLVGFLALDKAITIVFSAYVYRLSLRAIGGSIRKMVTK